MAPDKDYTHRSWIAVTLLIAVLIGLSLIPPQTLGGVSLRRANILSDLISFEEDLEKAEKAIDLDDADFHGADRHCERWKGSPGEDHHQRISL